MLRLLVAGLTLRPALLGGAALVPSLYPDADHAPASLHAFIGTTIRTSTAAS